MSDPTFKPYKVIAAEWDYCDETRDPPIPSTPWCICNMDGQHRLSDLSLVPEIVADLPLDDQMPKVLAIIQARLLIAGRGHFREVSLDDSDRIAIEAGSRASAQPPPSWAFGLHVPTTTPRKDTH